MGDEVDIRAAVNLARHLRASFFALLSFAVAVVGYFWLSLGRWQAVGYCAAVFVALTVLNHRSMLSKVEAQPTAGEH